MEFGAYVSSLGNQWTLWFGSMLGANELIGFFFPKWPIRELTQKHRWKVAVVLLIVAQFGAYRNLISEQRKTVHSMQGQVDEFEKRLSETNSTLLKLQGASEQKDKQIAELAATSNGLRDKLADARESRPIEVKVPAGALTAKAPEPAIEGLSFTTRQVPSPEEKAPFALEITIQARTAVSPFGIGLVADRALVGGKFNVVGRGVLTDVGSGPLNGPNLQNAERTFGAKANEGISPSNPWVVTVWAKEAFKIVNMVRLNQ